MTFEDTLHTHADGSDRYIGGHLLPDYLGQLTVPDDVEVFDPKLLNAKAPKSARFEAGNGSHEHLTHREIEKALLELNLKRYELDAIYFGNWLRDHSQLVDPKIVRAATMPKKFPDILSRDALTQIVDVLAIKEFPGLRENAADHFRVTPPMLGVYRPSEHIDNPTTVDLNTPDPTGHDPDFEPLLFPGNPLLEVDYDTSMKRYIRRSVDFMSRELQTAIDNPRTPKGLRAFGSALHVLEDFFAHSNFVELALIKNGYTDVLPWTSPADCKAGLPLVTGTFGAADTVASLVGPIGDVLFSIEDIAYQPIKAGDRSPREQVLLILLSEHQNPEYLRGFQEFLAVRDEWVNLPLAEFLQRSLKYFTGLSAVLGNSTGIILKDLLILFGENVDDWQTRYGQDPHDNGSTDPTHSQLAKDHAEHPLHLIAGKLAAIAIREVGAAVVARWDGDMTAEPIAVAQSYFRHPQGSDWQDGQIVGWATANPEQLKRTASKTELLEMHRRLAESTRDAVEQFRKDGATYLDFLRGEFLDSESPFWVALAATVGGSIAQTVLNFLNRKDGSNNSL